MAESGDIPVKVPSTEVPKVPDAPEKPNVKTSPETSEQSESVDLLIVFGQGPVKPLLLDKDLDEDMRKDWTKFKEDPLHSTEPNFRVLESNRIPDGLETNVYLHQLEGKSEAEIDAKMAEWQNLGRLGLNRWSRQNALATGYALVSG